MAADIVSQLKKNWKPGLTVALVNIPLSISLALAGGGTPLMGIITAIWAGLVAALLGGSHLNIVGPAGALSAILASFALLHGTEMLPLLALCAGLLTLVIYLLRWEKYIVFIPASVIHGFTLGVALTIGLNQLNFAFGLTGLTPHAHLWQNVVESLSHLAQAQWPTFAFFAIGLTFLFAWQRYFPTFPGAILLAPVGIVLGYYSSQGSLPFALQTLFTKYGEIEATLFSAPSLDLTKIDQDFATTAFAVMVIVVLETLISGKIADGMTKTKFNRRKEVLGIGLANIASGIMGGMPASGVFARTALNVKSGATHRTSAAFNAIIVALISLVFLPGFKYLPLAVVAAILVFAAVRMVQLQHFRHLYEHDKTAFGLSMLVAALTVGVDSVAGIVLGVAIALLVFVNKLSKGQCEVTVNKDGRVLCRQTGDSFAKTEEQGDILVYRFAGPLTYINSLPHIEMMERITKPHTVIFAFRNLFFMDIDGLDAIEEMHEILERKGIRVAFTGVSDLVMPLLCQLPLYKRKMKKNLVFESTSIAVQALHSKQTRHTHRTAQRSAKMTKRPPRKKAR